jgi:PKD repeat protein
MVFCLVRESEGELNSFYGKEEFSKFIFKEKYMKNLKTMIFILIFGLMICPGYSELLAGNGNFKLKKRVMTTQEFEKLKQKRGVYQPGKNYNQIIDGKGTGLVPPTAFEWNDIQSKTQVIDQVIENTRSTRLSSHDNSQTIWFPPVGNQGAKGACMTWAAVYYSKTFQEAKEHNWDLSGCVWESNSAPTAAFQGKIFSPQFHYHLANLGLDNGSNNWAVAHVLNEIGACTWEKLPYNDSEYISWPNEAAWRQAPLYRNAELQQFYLNADEDLNALKDFIADGRLSVISINANLYSNLTTNDLWTLDNYQTTSTNHANTIVGYDDNFGPYTEAGQTRYGAFKVVNSWGVGGWEKQADGFYWISYQCMKDQVYWMDFFLDQSGYQPQMIAVFQMNHERRGDCQIRIGIGPKENPLSLKNFIDYFCFPGDYPFPANIMVADITEFSSYLNGDDSFFIRVLDYGQGTPIYGDEVGTSAAGSIQSFGIEMYQDYASGQTTEAFYSAETPKNTVNDTTVYAEVSRNMNYCQAQGQNYSYEWIAGVSIAGFTNTSAASGYTDFTGQIIQLDGGQGVPITLTPGFKSSAYKEYWKIWIDFNRNGSFADAGELLYSGNSTGVIQSQMSIPSGLIGQTRMRVAMRYNANPPDCGSFDYGEVEDYSVSFTPAIAPAANFDFTANGRQVQFQDLSTDQDGTIVSWLWYFGDGSTSTVQHPFYTYAGYIETYVTLAVTDSQGLTDSTQKLITIRENEPPTASFTHAVSGLTVNFSDASTDFDGTIAAWQWNFGNGSTATVQNPSYTYASAGTYSVSLTVTDNEGASGSFSAPVTISAAAYCASSSNNSNYEYIKTVQIGSFSNTSAAAKYTDFTAQVINVNRSNSYSITLTPGFSGTAYNEYFRVYADLNQDGDFTDAGEQLFQGVKSSALTGTITIPASATIGSTRLRVVMRYGAYQASCGTYSYGETEDYTLNISL